MIMKNVEKSLELVKTNGSGKYLVTMRDNTKKVMRLFVSGDGFVCTFKRGSRKYGYPLAGFVEIELVNNKKKKSDVEIVRNFCNKVVKHLEKSGLWENMKKSYSIIANLKDEDLIRYIYADWDGKREMENKFGFSRFVDCLLYTAKRGIKSVNYNSWEKDTIIGVVERAIENKNDYSYWWRKGYDNRVNLYIEDKSGIKCATYSEEYKDCANGHYYFMIDSAHAIFMEDD